MTFHSAIEVDSPFLAHPPPQIEKRTPSSLVARSTQTTRRRSSTFSAIATWAAHVQPGSPASLSPHSPHRRPSITSVRTPSASFLHITPTPTTAHIISPSVRDFRTDLTALGYTSVFLRLPNTTPTLSSVNPPSLNAAGNIPIPPVPSTTCKPRGFTRFRSLSVLRSRARSKSVCPDSPTTVKVNTAAAIVKRKRAKYVMRPPPLTNQLALMQFADGGSLDDNIKRVMEAQARATGAAGLADVYCDGDGGIWLDKDEEWEYTHLLAEGDQSRPRALGDLQWVTFGSNTSPATACIPGDERRGSASTQDSNLHHKYIVQPADLLDGDDPVLSRSAFVPPLTHETSLSILSLPSRPGRTAKHLQKPDFLVDLDFSRLHTSPGSPKSPISSGVGVGMMKHKKKAKRRPAPLKLSPPSAAFKQPTNSPIDPDKVRQDFIDASFEPVSVSVPVTSATAVPVATPVDTRTRLVGYSRVANMPWRTVNDGLTSLGMKAKPSMLNMKALFRSGRKENVVTSFGTGQA